MVGHAWIVWIYHVGSHSSCCHSSHSITIVWNITNKNNSQNSCERQRNNNKMFVIHKYTLTHTHISMDVCTCVWMCKCKKYMHVYVCVCVCVAEPPAYWCLRFLRYQCIPTADQLHPKDQEIVRDECDPAVSGASPAKHAMSSSVLSRCFIHEQLPEVVVYSHTWFNLKSMVQFCTKCMLLIC